jgi:membrane protease YdiL (CAAX protease family)
MITQKQMTSKRAFWFAIITFIFAYVMWGIVALNPAGWFSFDSPQGIMFYILGGLSPAIVMFFLIKKWGKTKEEKSYFKPIFRTAHGWKPTVLMTTIFLAIYLVIATIVAERIEPWYMLAAFFPVMIIGGGVEEIGWRGFLQPALEKKLPFWLAAPIVGVIWAAWHIPLWFIPGTGQSNMSFLLFVIYTILMSYILGALQRLTGSVAASIAFHAWANVMFSVFNLLPIFNGKNITLFSGLMAVFAVTATIVFFIFQKKKYDDKV